LGKFPVGEEDRDTCENRTQHVAGLERRPQARMREEETVITASF
jgi:hypothetical protein